MIQTRLEKKEIKYSLGHYNKWNEEEQWIRITEGCPNDCPFCYEPKEYKIFKIPKIIRNKVKIMDMNLLCKPEAIKIIQELGSKKVNNKVVYYELICGVDFRYLTYEIAEALKKNRFRKIRLAWDWTLKDQFKIKTAIDMLKDTGYKGREIMVFMICNWNIPYEQNLMKLDLCKIWGVQVADCYYDNQTFPKVIPLKWTDEQNRDFRSKCRKHNQIVNFRIDPEWK